MLIATLDLFQNDPTLGVITVTTLCASLLIGITVHEFSHAFVASSLGDHTARALGRLSLNPIRHLDPIGTVLILVAGFGWGKPVPINPARLRIGIRPGMAAVSMAGPLSNIVAASVFGLALRTNITESLGAGVTVVGYQAADLIEFALVSLVRWNLILAVFNLLPIAPLDGFKVAVGILPRDTSNSFARLEPYGPRILLLLILAGFVLPDLRIFSGLLAPVVNLLSEIILGQSLL